MSLAALTVVLCYLALTRETAADSGLVRDNARPGASDTSSATDEPSANDDPSGDDVVKVPKVPNQRFADFTKGDDLPDESVIYDAPSNTSGMRLSAGGLTHGQVKNGETDGLGIIETELKTDVRSLGFRVRFAEAKSGSAVLVAWESSAVAAMEDDTDALPSGLRFVATAGTWSLSVITGGGEQVLTDGAFEPAAGPIEFRVVRDADEVFVVDPSGLVTTATKVRLGELTGPFASWGLLESGPDQTPAVIESVWAG
jgi:hypothetical protein